MYSYLLSFFIALFFFISSAIGQNRAQTKPNVIVILTDDQAWGDLSSNGNTNLNTPNIDRLGNEGASFKYFYVSPVCSPTRAELLTGRYHVRGGVYHTSSGGERLDLNETTIAEIFKKAGYATALFGKWHNGGQPPYHPNSRGFDEFYGFCSGHWGDYYDARLLEHNGKLVKGKGFIVDEFTNKAIEYIEQKKDAPFFVYLPFNTPHSPMQVPDKWWNKFKDKQLGKRYEGADKENIDYTRAALAMSENIDWNVGRVMETLKNLKLEENTIVVYLSDNGPNEWRWNGGMRGKKASTDEGGVRMPAFIYWKNHILPKRQIEKIADVIDLLPTLTDLAGIDCKTQKPLDGISLKPLLMGENYYWHDRYLFSYWKGKTSVRNQKYRLDDQGRLYNIYNDPGQKQDVSIKFPGVKNELQSVADQWKKDVASELPVHDERPFTVGYSAVIPALLPAGDGIPHGNLKRSNNYPNCTFFTNWTSIHDSITWNIQVGSPGDYEVTLFYTCAPQNVGVAFNVSFKESRLNGKIKEAFDPPLYGMENDRVTRVESYVKDFKEMKVGIMHLVNGSGELIMKASRIPGIQAMDVRMISLQKI